MMAGMPLIMTQAHGPGHIAFSRDCPGEMIALPLQPGQSIDVREHLFLVATGDVSYDWFPTNIWFTTKEGDETETHYPIGMYMDRFTAHGPGLLLLHAGGNVFVRTLAPGQTILVKPTAFLFKDPRCRCGCTSNGRPAPGAPGVPGGPLFLAPPPWPWPRRGAVRVRAGGRSLNNGRGGTIVDHSGATERRS